MRPSRTASSMVQKAIRRTPSATQRSGAVARACFALAVFCGLVGRGCVDPPCSLIPPAEGAVSDLNPRFSREIYRPGTRPLYSQQLWQLKAVDWISWPYRRKLSLSVLMSVMAMLRPFRARGCFPSSRTFRAAPAAALTAPSGVSPAASAVAAGMFKVGTSSPSSSAMASRATARPAKLSTPWRAASSASRRGVTSYKQCDACTRVPVRHCAT